MKYIDFSNVMSLMIYSILYLFFSYYIIENGSEGFMCLCSV